MVFFLRGWEPKAILDEANSNIFEQFIKYDPFKSGTFCSPTQSYKLIHTGPRKQLGRSVK